MASRKRRATPPVDTRSAKQKRDERALRRSAARGHVQPPRGRASRGDSGKFIQSPLLRLPAELRTTIFAYVFSGMEYDFSPTLMDDVIICWTSFNENNLGLIAASRQLHAETSLLPYKLAKFSFDFQCSKEEWTWWLQRFVKERTKEQHATLGRNLEVVEFNHDVGTEFMYYGTLAWVL